MLVKPYTTYRIMSGRMDKFSDWLLQELDKRDWNQAELHRRSGMSRTVISDVLAGKYQPGWEFCANVAKALQLPAEIVMSTAGLLPKIDDSKIEIKQLIYSYEKLNAADRQTILDLMEFLLSK